MADESARRKVLIVEDEQAIASSIATATRPSLEPLVAGTLAGARELLAGGDCDLGAAVVDLMLPDGSGLELVEELRRTHPVVPILILTGHAEPELINRAHALQAEYVCKPDYQDNLKEFLRRAVQPPVDDERRLAEAARVLASQHQLSVRETEILGLAVSGVPRGRIADVIGVSENTIKTQIRSILEKTHQNSLSDVVWLVRQAAGSGE